MITNHIDDTMPPENHDEVKLIQSQLVEAIGQVMTPSEKRDLNQENTLNQSRSVEGLDEEMAKQDASIRYKTVGAHETAADIRRLSSSVDPNSLLNSKQYDGKLTFEPSKLN